LAEGGKKPVFPIVSITKPTNRLEPPLWHHHGAISAPPRGKRGNYPADEPETDTTIMRGTDADYEFGTPTTADVALLVNVSDSTLSQDRGKKLSGYAKARITVHWIINLVDRQVAVFSRPAVNGYRPRQIFNFGDQVAVTIGGQDLFPIPVDSLLPRVKRTKGKGRPKG
jgi:Putative restriction endonuclease